jgi:hypothetical protein
MKSGLIKILNKLRRARDPCRLLLLSASKDNKRHEEADEESDTAALKHLKVADD